METAVTHAAAHLGMAPEKVDTHAERGERGEKERERGGGGLDGRGKTDRQTEREGGEREREYRIQNFIQLRPRPHMKGCEQKYRYTNILHITKWNYNKRSKFLS